MKSGKKHSCQCLMVLLPQLSSEVLTVTQNYQNAGVRARQGIVVMTWHKWAGTFLDEIFWTCSILRNIYDVPQGTLQG